jgi:Amt family ammonium transporter
MTDDDAAHGEEPYVLWGDGERFDVTRNEASSARAWGQRRQGRDSGAPAGRNGTMEARGVTIQV